MFLKSRKIIRVVTISLVMGIFLTGMVFLSTACQTSKAIPSEITKYTKDWPAPNKDLGNSRESTSSKINSGNVSTLGIAWELPITGIGEWGAMASNPLILGNTVILQDLKSNVYAVDLKTGKQLWMKNYDMDNIGPNGPAVGYGKIFVNKGHYEIAALDMQGNEVWSTKISQETNMGIDIAPMVFNNMVFVSTVPGISNQNFYKGGAVGILFALDASTGKTIWSFNTIDSKDIWGNPEVNSGGGSWYPPAIDTSTGMMYWPIANPGPFPGTAEFPNGSSRPGPNLYTNSIVALDNTSGQMKWYTQTVPHDLRDYDMQISPILATASINGTNKEIVLGAGKMGKVYAFDRNSGEILWETPVGLHKNDTLEKFPEGNTDVAPSPLGGVETVMAYSEGIVYAPYVDLMVQYTPSEFVASSFDLGKATGGLAAIDVTNGNIVWDVKFDSLDVGAATVVNDLVFTSTYDGKIYALDKKTGKELWVYQAGSNINGWPAVSGDTILFPVGLGEKPVLMALRLGATPPASNTPPETPAPGKGFQQ